MSIQTMYCVDDSKLALPMGGMFSLDLLILLSQFLSLHELALSSAKFSLKKL